MTADGRLGLILLTVLAGCLVGCLTAIGSERPEIPYDPYDANDANDANDDDDDDDALGKADDDDAIPADDDDFLGEDTCEEACSAFIEEYVSSRLAALRVAFVPAGTSEEADGCGLLYSSDPSAASAGQEVAYVQYLGSVMDPLLGQAPEGPRAVIAADGIGAYASPVVCESENVIVTTSVVYDSTGSVYLHPDWSWWSLTVVEEN